VSAQPANVPTTPGHERMRVDDLGYDDVGIFHVSLRYGFSETPDIPAALHQARQSSLLESDIDPDTASYFLPGRICAPPPDPGWRAGGRCCS